MVMDKVLAAAAEMFSSGRYYYTLHFDWETFQEPLAQPGFFVGRFKKKLARNAQKKLMSF